MPRKAPTHRPPTRSRTVDAERGRGSAGQWSKLYTLPRWRRRRAAQLRAEPLCAMHMQAGQYVAATVADHVIPHRGDPHIFWFGPLQSLCAACHNGTKQRAEKGGATVRRIGLDGFPV